MKYEIGPRIRKYRELQKLSQKELAQRLKVTNSAVSNWEQGLNRPDADTLIDLCKVLEVSPSELLDLQLPGSELSTQEWQVIAAYRAKPDLQKAVNILLGLDDGM